MLCEATCVPVVNIQLVLCARPFCSQVCIIVCSATGCARHVLVGLCSCAACSTGRVVQFAVQVTGREERGVLPRRRLPLQDLTPLRLLHMS